MKNIDGFCSKDHPIKTSQSYFIRGLLFGTSGRQKAQNNNWIVSEWNMPE